MSGRILSLQRQLRELGRLRTGVYDTSGRKGRPARSETWILSSHAENYIQAAAEAWGGSVERWQPQGGGAAQFRVITEQIALDAILPPGDPLSVSLELWSGGGRKRFCDGVTEQKSDSPCICRANFGESYHEQPAGTVCAATTRLNVLLPDMPDVGVWIMSTKSFYAAMEIAGAVDLIKAAVGHEATIPIRLRIEQRQRKVDGQTKKYQVVVVESRGINTGDLLGGTVVKAIEAPRSTPAIEAAPTPTEPEVKIDLDSLYDSLWAVESIEDWAELWPMLKELGNAELESEAEEVASGFLRATTTLEDLKALWKYTVTPGLKKVATTHAGKLKAPKQEGESAVQVWSRVMETVPESWTTTKAEQEFERFLKTPVQEGTAEQFKEFLVHLGGEE